ncbi:MAG: ferrochelatase [Chlorobium sp.]
MIRKKYAVVVVTYGEVEKVTIRSLWPSSRRILKAVTRQIAKIPAPLINFIADYRSTKHYIDWKLNRYSSLLLAINRAQKNRLADCIASSGSPLLSEIDINVFDACYFVPPYFDELLQQLRQDYDGIIIVPMFPVESAFSCGVACQMVIDLYGESAFSQVNVLSKLWKDDSLHRMYIEHLFGELTPSLRLQNRGKIGLVLVIHGTLVRDRAGNPPTIFTGLEETMAFFEMMKQKILADPQNIFSDIRQGCLNHSRGGEWTSDTIEKALLDFKLEGYEGVVMFPYGFFADNSETEYDARKMLEHASFPLVQYIRCINDLPTFGRWLADQVLKKMQALNNLQIALERLES